MHCGLCLPSCPTYSLTQVEKHSPRGRIALMKAIADDELEVSRQFAEEMYYCLGCLACMSACPAGVNYAELFEHARAEVEQKQVLHSPRRSLIRRFTIGWLFSDQRRLQFLGCALRLYQHSGLQFFIRKCGILKCLPKRLQELEKMTPTVQPYFSNELLDLVTPAQKEKRYRVALLTGCAQDLIFSDVNLDTAEVLARNGCEVITPAEQNCCGSLHAHNGEWQQAQQMARGMIDQFPPERFDAIITNAAGCGSHLKHYHSLLKDDLRYASKAVLWDQKVKDIHEWLAAIGWETPNIQPTSKRRTTYHEACHLAHGQQITQQPREILDSIPGLEMCELPESTWCCGSAGVYNIVQPETAEQLLQRKLEHVESTKAQVLATANPGCLLQILNGARERGMDIETKHPISLLAEAYRMEQS
ncbi:MAG: (Fe-S)-binding protein [Verrucomicrobiota bacterium]|nr:(Fe-S)-binding protein [Verrucomicrobiota bacterium]